MNNSTSIYNNNCSSYLGAAPNPPLFGIPQCAIINMGNNSAILSSCCGDVPTATFVGYVNDPPSCFIYCNITNPSITYQEASNCIDHQVVEPTVGVIACGPGTPVNSKPKPSGASKHGTKILGWMTVGFVVVSIVFIA
jgi:hypothetical protein